MHIEWIFGECPPVPESVRVKLPYYLAPFVAVFFARTFALAAAGLSFHRAAAALCASSVRCSEVRFALLFLPPFRPSATAAGFFFFALAIRSEEHTSELQSLR